MVLNDLAFTLRVFECLNDVWLQLSGSYHCSRHMSSIYKYNVWR